VRGSPINDETDGHRPYDHLIRLLLWRRHPRKPEVPEWLKQEWRARGLLKKVQLTISYCLGPCDLTNVVRSPAPTSKCGSVRSAKSGQYAGLLEWAEQCKATGSFLLLPFDFVQLRFSPFEPIIK
jgi:hypothetical protein